MTTLFFNRAGVDFDDLFERDPAGIAIPGYLDEFGNPLLFASIQFGTKIADVEHYHPDPPYSDVTNYWAGKGTVIYINPTALPTELYAITEGSAPSASATVSFYFARNGILTLNPGLDPFWVSPQTPTAGDVYDIRFTVMDGGPLGVLTGEFNSWLQMNTTRGVSLTVTQTQSGARTAWRQIRVEIRRRSDLVVVFTRLIDMEAEAAIT